MAYYANLGADFIIAQQSRGGPQDPGFRKKDVVQFDLSDIIFLVVVLSIAVLLINSSGGGGGHRARVPVLR
jgi:hypothetical protein